ncbi:MAG: hypothetical protein H0X27_00070 [Caulobacteraceae bacterium]|nr:hypothetical protein [Caulobacteraceae bacterium]
MTDLWGGVFTIHALASADVSEQTDFLPVERLLGPDPLGVLYASWSDDFLSIAAEMGGALKLQKRGVAPFTSMYHSHGGIREAFPWEKLAVGFLFREAPVIAWGLYLAQYRVRFGENSPLNDELSA